MVAAGGKSIAEGVEARVFLVLVVNVVKDWISYGWQSWFSGSSNWVSGS